MFVLEEKIEERSCDVITRLKFVALFIMILDYIAELLRVNRGKRELIWVK